MSEVEQPKFSSYLNIRNAIMPAFATDNQHLLYLSDITGTYQVFSVDVTRERDWPEQLSFYDDRVTGLYPNPTATAFLITRDRGGDEQDQFYLLQGNATTGVTVTTLLETPEYKNNFGAWRPDGQAYCFSSNRRHPSYFDIYTHELDSEPVLVYQADETLYPRDWSLDGRYILCSRANTNLDYDLLLIDLHNPAEKPRHLTPHQGSASYSQASFSPDGHSIFLLCSQDRDFLNPAKIELATGQLSYLSDKPWDSDVMRLSPDGSKLAYEVNEEGYSRLFILDLTTAQEQEVKGFPRGIVTGIGLWESLPVWSPDGQKLAVSFNSPIHNADIWVYTLETGALQPVTFNTKGGIDPRSFIMPELVHYPTFDGRQIPGLLFLPKGAKRDSSTPFIVYVHGGPEGQTRFIWNPVIQYYVARGYGILAPNVRGSSGYGKEYLALDDVQKRPDSVADLKAAVEWLRDEGYCDPKRVAIQGQSYGGFMVLMALVTYPELWAAGIDIYGIGNMLTFLQNTSPYRLKLRTPEYGDPEVDRDFLIEISAIHKIDRITAPLMVIHGARDPRVPVGESDQMVEALRSRQHPVEYIVFEDEGHSISRLKNKLVAFPAIGDFLDRYLGSA